MLFAYSAGRELVPSGVPSAGTAGDGRMTPVLRPAGSKKPPLTIGLIIGRLGDVGYAGRGLPLWPGKAASI
jgi:hypothetical protein